MSMNAVAADRRRTLFPWFVTLTAILSSCDCAGDRLVVVDPDDGTVYGASDDADTSLGGLQRDVVVDVTGLRIGTAIQVFVGTDKSTVVEAGDHFDGVALPDGHAKIRATLPNGTVYLRACAGTNCSVRSPLRTVTVTGSVGTCPFVQFEAPRPSGSGTLVLGSADDADVSDGACGASFATPVRARVQADEGTSATLFVDGIATATTLVTDGAVDFGAVTLGARGSVTSTLHVEIQGDDGLCSSAHPQAIGVDCAGPSCVLVPPITGRYLNATLDADTSDPGLDLNLSVQAPVTTVGRDFTLLDASTDATLAMATATGTGGGATARFLGVPLAEGPVQLAALCTDGTASTRSASAEYVVDATPCPATISAPTAGHTFTSAEDDDGDLSNGLQTMGTVTTSGADCVDFRVAACGALPSTGFDALVGSSGSHVVDLGTSGTQTICAQVRDVAGNLGEDEITVAVAPSGGPVVAITTPGANARINHAGGVYLGQTYLADASPGTTSCELDVVVDCSVVGTAVTLVVDGATSGMPQANCAANTSSSLGGRATFTGVSFPAGSGPAHVLVARQTSGTLVGTSPAIALQADCAAPTLAIATPTCGGSLGPADDVSPSAGIQAPVTVSSPNVPQVDVTVTVSNSSGGSDSVTSLAANLPANATAHQFSSVGFGGAGTVQLAASAIDAFGNAAVTPACALTIAGLPSIALDALPTTTFNAANATTYDCNTGNTGLDLTISGTTDATLGSQVTLQIGSGAPLLTSVVMGMSGRTFTGCVAAPEGTSQVTAIVNDTVSSDGVSGMANAIPITIQVSTTQPSNAITPITVSILDRRAGVATFSFTAVGDGSSTPQPLASYQVRCAGSPIVSEGEWSTAIPFSFDPHVPGNPGTPEVLTVRGFFTGAAPRCVVRGVDVGANLTPIPAAASQPTVTPSFLVATFAGMVPGGSMGTSGARAVGDVNGDGQPDFLVSGERSAYLFLGQTAGAPPVLATTFGKTQGSNYFGSVARGIGDFNRDGLDDVAIADPAESSLGFDGEVYVFYGRASWPGGITVDETTCTASFCVRGAAGGGESLGWDVVGLGDFDGVTGEDLAIAMPTGNAVLVLTSRNDVPAGTDFVIGTSDPTGFRIVAPGTAGNFGWTLGAPGNVSGSANADLVIGQTGDWPTPGSSAAQLFRVEGRSLGGGSGLTSISGTANVVGITTDVTLPSNFGTLDLLGIGFGDFDADGSPDLFAYSINTPSVNVGGWVLYGSGAATYPFTNNSARIRAGGGVIAEASFGQSRASAFDPLFGHVGDVNLDGADDFFAGGITATNDGTHSVGLVYGRSTRVTGTLTIESDLVRSAILAPAVESYPASPPRPIWYVGYPGNVVQDTTTGYPDLVICDPGTSDSGVPGDSGRIFVLY